MNLSVGRPLFLPNCWCPKNTSLIILFLSNFSPHHHPALFYQQLHPRVGTDGTPASLSPTRFRSRTLNVHYVLGHCTWFHFVIISIKEKKRKFYSLLFLIGFRKNGYRMFRKMGMGISSMYHSFIKSIDQSLLIKTLCKWVIDEKEKFQLFFLRIYINPINNEKWFYR